jgi:archaellum component FlaF (FlaF/FlaG flagellin family)
MKSSYLRAGLALLCAVILSACGGHDGSLSLSGTIAYPYGVKSGLVLVNKGNGEKLVVADGATSFVFTKLMAQDQHFDVEVDTPPNGAICKLTNNDNKANVYTVYSVIVTCNANLYNLGGTVYNLKAPKGMVLANGIDQVGVLPSATTPGADVTFVFPTKVADGSLYGATVAVQPDGQTCTVDPSNNPGYMPNRDGLGLIVNCVDNTK